MNGKRAFVISSPYLVTGLCRRGESFVYVAENKKNVAAEPRGRKQSHTASKSNLLPTGSKFSRLLRVCGLESANHHSKNRVSHTASCAA